MTEPSRPPPCDPSSPDPWSGRSTTVRTDGGVLESHTLRRGGKLELMEDALRVTDDDESIRVPYEKIVEVSHSSIDFFLGILSLALVGFGILSLERNALAGLAFTVIGFASLYRTYGRRGQLKFRVQGRAKPLIVYPEQAEATYNALEPYVALN